MNNWQKFIQLTRKDQVRLLVYPFLLVWIQAGLAIVGYQRWRDYLDKHPKINVDQQPPSSVEMSEARHIAELVTIAGNHGYYRATCLRQSLLLYWLLKRRGITSKLRIGINHKNKFNSHAWIEINGEVIIGNSQVNSNFSVIN